MSCMPFFGSRPSSSSHALVVHSVVEQPMTSQSTGKISCRPIGKEPIRFQWTGPGEVKVDASGSEASDLVVGRYDITVRDALDAQAKLTIYLRPIFPTAIVVHSYVVTHSSSGVASDGDVTAVGFGLDESPHYLWSNGSITDAPYLKDVGCGIYSLVPYHVTPYPTFVQTCPPAVVETR